MQPNKGLVHCNGGVYAIKQTISVVLSSLGHTIKAKFIFSKDAAHSLVDGIESIYLSSSVCNGFVCIRESILERLQCPNLLIDNQRLFAQLICTINVSGFHRLVHLTCNLSASLTGLINQALEVTRSSILRGKSSADSLLEINTGLAHNFSIILEELLESLISSKLVGNKCLCSLAKSN